ncbi:SRPBCC family protein [Micromonospora tarensis]|uniref:Uncharacterized protein n=1 Tax=Micromonospora tarensis TaxID=2806100 RepID=A0ABS1YPX5_9ACTN|nr:hypothetical protein [Micromonospora tarensis]MBM0279485.1 hypothetical protein [Micromonospora tarensis]
MSRRANLPASPRDTPTVIHYLNAAPINAIADRWLSRWHGFRAEHAAHFGWSAEELAARLGERRSTVTFEIEPHSGSTVRLTVIHDGFSPDSEMHRAISGHLDGKRAPDARAAGGPCAQAVHFRRLRQYLAIDPATTARPDGHRPEHRCRSGSCGSFRSSPRLRVDT